METSLFLNLALAWVAGAFIPSQRAKWVGCSTYGKLRWYYPGTGVQGE
jgi:hypothetical protein